MKRIRIHFILFVSSVLLVSCAEKAPETQRVVILEVEGKFLYKDDIQQIIPPNINAVDSADIAQRFIRKWVTDILMYENAKRNISNQKEIDALVEGYRKSLIVHQYQQKLIEQRLPKEPAEEELKAFYDQYSEQLELKEAIIQGFLLVVPAKAAKIENVRSWVQSGNEKALENIEKYSIQNAISYDYFGNKWMSFTEILKKIPLQVDDPSDYVATHRFIETSDSLQRYFLRITNYKKSGQVEPYEMAKNKITNILQNKLKADFMAKFETELYNDAVANEDVTFFKK